jgi:type VI secretion system VasD/TssJ family lipoprotein
MIGLSTAALLFSCASAPLVQQPPEWGYEKDAISLRFTGDPHLNLFQKQAHSLIVCLYQLKDLNGFSQLSDEKDGLPKLLDCSRFDPSVTYAKRLVIQPNQKNTQSLDRTEGAKYLGCVAGYYTLRKESSIRSYPIPLTDLEKNSRLPQKPAKLSLDLYLGPLGIRPSENPTSPQPK